MASATAESAIAESVYPLNRRNCGASCHNCGASCNYPLNRRNCGASCRLVLTLNLTLTNMSGGVIVLVCCSVSHFSSPLFSYGCFLFLFLWGPALVLFLCACQSLRFQVSLSTMASSRIGGIMAVFILNPFKRHKQ